MHLAVHAREEAHVATTLFRRWIAITPLIAVVPLINACHVCRTRQVTATFTGQITVDGQSTQASLSGGASESAIGSQYDRLERVISDASSPAIAQTVIFTLEQAAPTGLVDFLSVQMPLPVQQGASVPVALFGRMGGWGTVAAGPRPPLPGTPADVYVAKAGFIATSADGSLLVLDTLPLRLRMNVTFRSDDGRTVVVAGNIPFRVTDDRELCGFE
jgi:hypothetical protein